MNYDETDINITSERYDNNVYNYLVRYVIPEVMAFQLANSYYRDELTEASLLQHYNSMINVFNVFPSLDETKKEIISLLNIKYNLKIISEDPLRFDKWNK